MELNLINVKKYNSGCQYLTSDNLYVTCLIDPGMRQRLFEKDGLVWVILLAYVLSCKFQL